MKKKARKATTESAAGAVDDEADVDAAPQIVLEDQNSDLCQKLMDRYANSSAPQHSHLCASAAAMRAILQEEGLPLTPLAYFAATISAIDDATASEVLDSDAIAALASFLSMLVPLVPSEAMPASKAVDAVAVLIRLLEKGLDGVGTATVRCVVKALGDLLVLCDLGDWEGIRSPFEVIVGLCFDKRPKVRRCAQMCVEKVFKSFNYSFVIKEACKVVLSLFDLQLPLALEFPTEKTGDASKNESDLKQENFKVLHTLNLVKLSVPYLSKKASSKIFLDILELLTCQFAPIVSHSLTILEAFFESSTAESIIPEAEKIIFSLVSLISSGEKYPRDTIVFASVLAKRVLGELHRKNLSAWIGNLPLVFCSIAGMLVLDANISTQAADILKDLVNNHIDMRFFHDCETQSDDGRALGTAESRSIESICVALENLLCSNRVPNGATLAVISDLFLKLGKISSIYMKGILVKLANVMLSNDEGADIMHLHDCIGSAVTAMGPEKTLAVIPISFQEESFTFSNIWLIPILKKYVVGTSLEYFIENIMPLVESLQRASHKVKKASLRKKLQTYLHELWDLLPAFCRYPTDTQKNFEPLSKIFADLLRKDSSMHENIALALQELVNQNKIIVQSSCNVDSVTHLVTCNVEQLKTAATSVPHHYSTKIATRNVKALSSCSNDLLQALADVFFDSPPEKRIVLKEAISCLASITKTSKVKRIFTSTLEKYRLTNGVGASEKLESVGLKSVDSKHQENVNKEEGKAHQSIILEFSSSLVEGANEDLINMIFDYIRLALEDTSGVGQAEAYYTLSRIFKEHTWFISSRFDEMMNLLVGVNSPTDSLYLRSRFACMHDLFVHILQSDFEEKSSKAFLILNEVILALKNSNEEARKAAYDLLMRIGSSLKNASSIDSDSPRQKLYNMIMGYLSGTPPQIMTGAVSALSLLIYKDSAILFSIPELVPSVLVLLQSKAMEIIKVVLGFVKVLVSCLQANDLQKILPDIVSGILPWSSVSRNHFRSKVTVIFEIIIRKCGAASVLSLAPEKYKGFIKAVSEQRHGRISLKDVDSTTAMPVEPPASPIKRSHKRKHEEMSHQGEGTGSGATPNRTPWMKMGKKREFNASSANKFRHNGGIHRESRKEYRSKGPHAATLTAKYGDGGKQAGRGLNKRFNTRREEEAIGFRKETRSKPASHIPASTSKFHKHSKNAAGPQRTKK